MDGKFSHSFFSRLLFAIIRKALTLFWIGSKFQTSIFFAENKPNVRVTIDAEYSKEELFRFLHPVDLIEEPHLFASRKAVTLDRCYLDTRNGVAFDPTNKIISESSSWPIQHLMMSAVPKPILKPKRNGNSSRSILLPTSGYYHWLLEDLPPFLYLQSQFPESEIIVNSRTPKYVKSLIKHLKISPITVPHFIEIPNLTLVTRNSDVGWPHKSDIEFVKKYFADNCSKTQTRDRIYISRVSSTRSPDFEAELSKKLEENGWLILQAEELEFLDQIQLISGAKILCGVGGAGLSNCIWMSPGTQLIELSPDRFVPVFARLASRLALKYKLIKYEDFKNSATQLFRLIESESI